MDSYLSRLRAGLDETCKDATKRLHVVLGNESCDLDSAVSALVFAYFLHLQEQRTSQCDTIFIPVLNIPRREYRLRTEVRYVLSDVFHNSVEDWLIFIDEVPLDVLYDRGALSLTLVDHHKLLNGPLARYGPSVYRVIDHRIDNTSPTTSLRTQCYGQEDGFERYTTDIVGSCSTLVAERIITQRPELIADEKVAKLLLSAVLIDTGALRDSAKTTARDITVVEKLEESLTKQAAGNYERRVLFGRIAQAKTDTAAMTILEILAKDYKVIRRNTNEKSGITSIGTSTVLMTFEALSTHDPSGGTMPLRIENELESFRKQKEVDSLVLICVNQSAGIPFNQKKQIVVYGRDDVDCENIFQALSSIDGLWLTLLGDVGSSSGLRVYRQGNPAFSRKMILPVLEAMLEGTLFPPHANVCSPSTNAGTPSNDPNPMDSANASPNVSSDQQPEIQRQEDDSSLRATAGQRAKRFLDSTDLARSFSVTYDGDDDEYFESTPQDDHPDHVERVGQDLLSPTPGSTDFEPNHQLTLPSEESFSCSPTEEEESRHYPTVCTTYATSSGESGIMPGGNNANTQEESLATTLSGVPDLLDSRENLTDPIQNVSKDTPDLLAEYCSSDLVLEAPSTMKTRKLYEERGDVDILQGTSSVNDHGPASTGPASVQTLDGPCSPTIEIEPSFTSYHPLVANYQPGSSYVDRMKRETSEQRMFDFSSDPSPATGLSRADTPPSSMGQECDDDSDFKRKGDEEFGLKMPGAVTPPNTFVDKYLDENVAPTMESATARRASQQSNLEPELLYMKLKGTQDKEHGRYPDSPALFLPEGSVPGTPPNSFVGTPTMSSSALETTMAKQWHKFGDQLEPENLRMRVTELTKNLPQEDVEGSGNW